MSLTMTKSLTTVIQVKHTTWPSSSLWSGLSQHLFGLGDDTGFGVAVLERAREIARSMAGEFLGLRLLLSTERMLEDRRKISLAARPRLPPLPLGPPGRGIVGV